MSKFLSNHKANQSLHYSLRVISISLLMMGCLNFIAVFILMLTTNILLGKVTALYLLASAFLGDGLMILGAIYHYKAKLATSGSAFALKPSTIFTLIFALLNLLFTGYLLTFVPPGLSDAYTFLGLIFLVAINGVATVIANTLSGFTLMNHAPAEQVNVAVPSEQQNPTLINRSVDTNLNKIYSDTLMESPSDILVENMRPH